jgi:hypothetical protein
MANTAKEPAKNIARMHRTIAIRFRKLGNHIGASAIGLPPQSMLELIIGVA